MVIYLGKGYGNTVLMLRVLRKIQNKSLPIDDFHIACNMDCGQGVVTSDHDTLHMVSKLIRTHLTTGLLTRCEASANIFKTCTASGLRGQWKTKNPAKVNRLSTSLLANLLIYTGIRQHTHPLSGMPSTHLVVTDKFHLLNTKRQHPATIPREPLVGFIVVLRHLRQHRLDGLRSSLHRCNELASRKCRDS